MEKAVGIVSEFNPFHNGHAHLLQTVRSQFPEKPILCVMSGNFVQRGEFAVQEKYSRARCALEHGADLVLEIPYPFSTLSAESFAQAGVDLLQKTGLADTIAFGTELLQPEALCQCAANLETAEFQTALSAYLAENPSSGYPNAKAALYEASYGKTPILDLPNASLAVEYLRCNLRFSHPLSVFPVLRVGDSLREEEELSRFPSATALRAALHRGARGELRDQVPPFVSEEWEREEKAGRFPVSEEALASVLLYLLKTETPSTLRSYYGMSNLVFRAKKAADGAETVAELTERIRSPHVTDSRIRRALLATLLRTPRYAEKERVSYTTVLGASPRGRELLSSTRKDATLPVFTKPSHPLKDSRSAVVRQASAAALADRIYLMAFSRSHEEGFFLKKMPVLL